MVQMHRNGCYLDLKYCYQCVTGLVFYTVPTIFLTMSRSLCLVSKESGAYGVCPVTDCLKELMLLCFCYWINGVDICICVMELRSLPVTHVTEDMALIKPASLWMCCKVEAPLRNIWGGVVHCRFDTSF